MSKFSYTPAEELAQSNTFWANATGMDRGAALKEKARELFPGLSEEEYVAIVSEAARIKGRRGGTKRAWTAGMPPQPKHSEQRKKVIHLTMQAGLVSAKFRSKPKNRDQRELFHEPNLRPRRRGKRRRT